MEVVMMIDDDKVIRELCKKKNQRMEEYRNRWEFIEKQMNALKKLVDDDSCSFWVAIQDRMVEIGKLKKEDIDKKNLTVTERAIVEKDEDDLGLGDILRKLKM